MSERSFRVDAALLKQAAQCAIGLGERGLAWELVLLAGECEQVAQGIRTGYLDQDSRDMVVGIQCCNGGAEGDEVDHAHPATSH